MYEKLLRILLELEFDAFELLCPGKRLILLLILAWLFAHSCSSLAAVLFIMESQSLDKRVNGNLHWFSTSICHC